jgi:NADPH2:quinone reductase
MSAEVSFTWRTLDIHFVHWAQASREATLGAMTNRDALSVVREFLAHADGGAMQAARSLLSPELRWVNRGLPTDQVCTGPHEVLEKVFSANQREWTGFRARTLRSWQNADGNVTSVGSYTGAGAYGKALDAPFTHRWSVRQGRIAAFEQTVDRGAVRCARGQVLGGARPESERHWLLSDDAEQAQLVGGSPASSADGCAVVRVEAVGLNFADVMQMEGRYPAGPARPYIPGFELAGIVDFIEGAAGIQVGDRVAALAPGALATHMVVPVERLRRVGRCAPTSAAGSFVREVTAFACVERLGAVAAKQRVLVTAGASSVGITAIRLARARGAEVVATVSSESKRDLVVAAGAADAVLSTTHGWVEALRRRAPEGFDVILESVGGQVYEACLTLLRPFGRLVVYGSASGQAGTTPDSHALLFSPRMVGGFELATLLAQGDPSPLLPPSLEPDEEPVTLWPLEDAARALESMRAREAMGKQVVVVQ